MKAMFGVVSLLVALVIVGLLAVRQLKAVGHAGGSAGMGAGAGASAGAAATLDGMPAVPAMSGSGTVRAQAVQLQNKVAADAIKAMNDGAATRSEAADK